MTSLQPKPPARPAAHALMQFAVLSLARSTGVALSVAVMLVTASAALAQPTTMGQAEDAVGVAVYRFSEPGEPVIAVDLWGSARRTGRYFVAPETTLLDLLTLSGGPPSQAETEGIIRETTVEVSRMSEGSRAVVFEVMIDSLASGGMVPPPLHDQDVVTLTTTVEDPFGWLDALTVVAGVASLALVILRLTTGVGI